MKRLFILLFFFLAIKPTYSQSYQIGAVPGLYNLGIPDTVTIGDSINLSIFIKNFGTNLYSGMFFVNIGIDTTGSNLIVYPPLDTVSISIPANDSIPLFYIDSIPQSGPFRIGGNIIVIWPASFNFQAYDSARATVYVMSSSSIGEIVDRDNIKVYPNPTSDEINVLQNKPNNSVVRVRIFNSLGQEVEAINNSSIIDLRCLSSGTYIVEAEFADKTKSSFRIIKK